MRNVETKPVAKEMPGNSTVKRIMFSTKAMSAKMPRIRLSTAPHIGPSNMPTATATAGRIIGQTPAMRSWVKSMFCTSSAKNR